MANRASWNGGRRADDRLGFCQVTMAVHTSPPDGRGRPRIGRLLACLLACSRSSRCNARRKCLQPPEYPTLRSFMHAVDQHRCDVPSSLRGPQGTRGYMTRDMAYYQPP